MTVPIAAMTAGLARISSGGPSAINFAEVNDNDAITDAHNEFDIVFDEEHGHPPASGQAADQFAELIAFTVIEASGRLHRAIAPTVRRRPRALWQQDVVAHRRDSQRGYQDRPADRIRELPPTRLGLAEALRGQNEVELGLERARLGSEAHSMFSRTLSSSND